MNTILVVDDEPVIRRYCARVLTGWKVREAADVGQALRILAERKPTAFVLTDLEMPGGDGWSLARWLRENRPGVPVGIMTGCSFPGAREQARAVGAVAFLEKPFPPGRLASVVRRFAAAQ
jgi:CheY-like chemotaxis protein